MKSALLVLCVIALACIGLGFYMGWFQLSSNNHDTRPNISLAVDTDKLVADKDKAMDAVQGLGQPVEDEVTDAESEIDHQGAVSEQPAQTQE